LKAERKYGEEDCSNLEVHFEFDVHLDLSVITPHEGLLAGPPAYGDIIRQISWLTCLRGESCSLLLTQPKVWFYSYLWPVAE
jgi:hypothetical protein